MLLSIRGALFFATAFSLLFSFPQMSPCFALPAASLYPSKDSTYTVTATMQIAGKVSPADVNDADQQVTIIRYQNGITTLRVTYFPFANSQRPVSADPDWRTTDKALSRYTKPSVTANWDPAMRSDLIAALLHDGIDVSQMNDYDLVTAVSKWALERCTNDSRFVIWDYYYPNGKPAVYPPLRQDFDLVKGDASVTDAEMASREVLGKDMYYGKVTGDCTSMAVYLTTVLRALGIPTRIVVWTPPFDYNDKKQAAQFISSIHHHALHAQIAESYNEMKNGGDFTDHMVNEVYVGHRWVELNDDSLAGPDVNISPFGLSFHIARCTDISELNLAQTWGLRMANYPDVAGRLTSVNPYSTISDTDKFGRLSTVSNPPVHHYNLTSATVTGLYYKNSSSLPSSVYDEVKTSKYIDFLLAIKDPGTGGYHALKQFSIDAPKRFILTSDSGMRLELENQIGSITDDSFQAFCLEITSGTFVPQKGAHYELKSVDQSATYKWNIPADVPVYADAN
jgi:hypothetical protein